MTGGESSDRLELRYRLEAPDLESFAVAWARHAGDAKRAERVSYLLALVPVASGVAVAVLGDPLLGIGLGVLGIALALGARPFWRQSVHRQLASSLASARRPGLLGDRTITVDADGLVDTGEWDSLRLWWPAVLLVLRTDDTLCLVHGPGQAVIVPKRAFPDVASFEGFAAAVECYRSGYAR